jgi:hypothetical protein
VLRHRFRYVFFRRCCTNRQASKQLLKRAYEEEEDAIPGA